MFKKIKVIYQGYITTSRKKNEIVKLKLDIDELVSPSLDKVIIGELTSSNDTYKIDAWYIPDENLIITEPSVKLTNGQYAIENCTKEYTFHTDMYNGEEKIVEVLQEMFTESYKEYIKNI